MPNCSPHRWVVFSTALMQGSLMLLCLDCGAYGTVDNPTKEEWSAAFHAPSEPYFWNEPERVNYRGDTVEGFLVPWEQLEQLRSPK